MGSVYRRAAAGEGACQAVTGAALGCPQLARAPPELSLPSLRELLLPRQRGAINLARDNNAPFGDLHDLRPPLPP